MCIPIACGQCCIRLLLKAVHLRPFIVKALLQKQYPFRISLDFNRILGSYPSLARNISRDLEEIINRINRNKFKIDIEHRSPINSLPTSTSPATAFPPV